MKSRFQVLAAAVLFSTGGAAIKATSLSSWQVASFRCGLAAAALWLLLPRARGLLSLRSGAIGIAYAGALVFYALANKLTTAANTIFLQSTAPLYVLALAPWLLGERLRRRDLAFMLAVAAGIAMVFVDVEPPVETAPDPFLGNVLAGVTGISFALAIVGLRWLGRGEAGGTQAISAVIWGNLIAFVVCLRPALPVVRAGLEDWLVVVYLGLFQVALAYLLLTSGLRRVPALEASLLLLVEPVLNPVWAWWIHGETPGGWSLAGGALILGATAVKILGEERYRRGPGDQSASPRVTAGAPPPVGTGRGGQ